MSDEYTRPQLREIVYHDAVLRIMKDYAMGEGRAIPKEEIWESAIRLWDRTNKDFLPPTISWYNTKHPRYREYCAGLGIVILHCADGIFIAETQEEIDRWDAKYNEGWLRGIERSNNKLQETIENKGLGRGDGLKVFIQRLFMKHEETGDEEE